MAGAARGRVAQRYLPQRAARLEALERRRLFSAGELDIAFGGGDGLVTTDFTGSIGNRGRPVAIQPDGKILQAGWHQVFGPGGDLNFGIVRLNPDGTPDTTFGVDGRVAVDFDGRGDLVNAIAVAPDGKIVVAGNSSMPYTDPLAADTDVAVVRLNPDGSLDASFDGDGKTRINYGTVPGGTATTSDFAWRMTLDGQGRVVLAGSSNLSGTGQFAVARLTTAGALDTTFGGGDGIFAEPLSAAPGFGGSAYGITHDPAGRVLISGVGGPDSRNGEFVVARFNPGGALDSSFDADGWTITPFRSSHDWAVGLDVTNDGKIVAGGYTTGVSATETTDAAAVRYNDDGSLDTTFGPDGTGKTVFNNVARNELVNDMDVDSQGRIVLGGRSGGSGIGSPGYAFAVRFTPGGLPDAGFGAGGLAESQEMDEVLGVAVRPANDFVVLGGADTPPNGGFDDFALLRLDASGFPDPAFGPDFNGIVRTDFVGPGWNIATSVAVQPDGRFVVGGWVLSNNSTDRDIALARYLPDGTLDGTFGTGGRVVLDVAHGHDSVSAVAVDGQGRILATGFTTGAGGDEDIMVVRFNPDGTVDDTFGAGGVARATDFDGLLPADEIGNDLVILPDGRIAVAGERFVSTSNVQFAIAVFDPSGNLDPSFTGDGVLITPAASSGTSSATAIALMPDGDTFDLVAGGTARVSNADQFAVVRVNLNGTLDSTFDGDGRLNTTMGAGGAFIRDIAVDADRRIVAAGYANVSTPAGTRTDFALARFLSGGTLDTTFDLDGKVLSDFNGNRDQANALLLAPDGSIYVAGFAEAAVLPVGVPQSSFRDFAVARFDSSGQRVNDFDADGRVTTDFAGESDAAASLALTPGGQLLAAGFATMPGAPNRPGTGQDFAVARYVLVDEPAATVTRRELFYNHSALDGNDPAITNADFDAVALKQPLLPGLTATADTYTSYHRGINGLIVSFSGKTAPTAQDFVFRTGDGNDPSAWAAAPAPTAIEVRTLSGAPGKVVAFTFPDGAIRNTWLQVTVLATPRTRLAAPSLFYFGNLVGDAATAEGATRASVDAADVLATRLNASRRSVNVLNAFDYNRDGVVNVVDQAIARSNVGRSIGLFTPAAPAAAASTGGVFSEVRVFSRRTAPARRRPPLIEL